jgi:hypothetical protein
MPTPGRPQLLDTPKKNTILSLLTVGCSRTTAAHYVNCDPKTIYNTARRDPEFADRLARAENSSEFTYLARILKAGDEPRYWRSAAWALERMFPDRFGARSPDSVTPQQLSVLINQLMEMLVEEVPVAMYRKKIIERLHRIAAPDDLRRLPPPKPRSANRPTTP